MTVITTPPACIGIMGGGQLARMLAIAAKQMGYQIAIIEPDTNCPAKLFANHHIMSKYDDKDGLDQLAKISSVITTEFENVPAGSIEYLEQKTIVYPKHHAIATTQNRIAEKIFFNTAGIKTTKYQPINNIDDVHKVDLDIFPAILKTNTLGYDGKGQIKVYSVDELNIAFQTLEQVPCILEKMVHLFKEVSIMVARNQNEIVCYPVAENIHTNGILDTTIVPAQIDEKISAQIELAAKTIIAQLDYIGILGIEFFITTDHQILANEMAPRPHNSGHYTIDACLTSQFEQQVRAICDLKLGSTELLTHAVMLNLLGDIWPKTNDSATSSHNNAPPWDKILSKYDNVKLHLYDKTKARIGRKMGHLTVLGKETSALLAQTIEIKQILGIY